MKRFILCGGLLVIFLRLSAGEPSDSLFFSKVSDSFGQVTSAPQEKVYLHTDKPYYFTGDTIWIKAYLVDAISHRPAQGSRYVYIELINRKDKLRKRLKLPIEDRSFEGCIDLDKDIDEGDYYIRAYTQWMRNASPDYFFSKNIRVISSQSALFNPSIRYEEENGDRKAIITFLKTPEGVFGDHYVHYMVRTKDKGNPFHQQKTNKNGEIQVKIPKRESLEQYIYVALEDGMQKHKHTFYVPDNFDYQVEFFPEGGPLIANSTQKIGFKAVDTNGDSVDISGFILNQQGDTLTHLNSSFAGIGNFLLSTRLEDTYKAVVTTARGETRTFNLPAPEKDRYALTTTIRGDILRYHILGEESESSAKVFYLLAHMRGSILFINRVENFRGAFHIKDLPEGILSLVLLNADCVPQSERLLFLWKEGVSWSVRPDKEEYDARSPVMLHVSLSDNEGKPLSGDFSLSVTDNYAVSIDTACTNICSYLLLNSDLKGHVESPGYYFRENTPRTRACLDNLLLTQGWSRFDVEAVLKERIKSPEFFMELEQYIAGSVVDIKGAPLADKPVSVSINNTLRSPVMTDRNGNFIIRHTDFTNRVRVEARVYEKSAFLRPSIKINKDNYPEAYNKQPYRHAKLQPKQQEFVEQLQSPFVMEDGMWMARLPEVVISAKAVIKERFSSYKLNDEEVIAQKKASTALDLIMQVPGFTIIDNTPYLDPSFSMRPGMSIRNDANNRNALRPDGTGSGNRALGNNDKRGSYGPRVSITLNDKNIHYRQLAMVDASEIVEVYKMLPEVDAAIRGLDAKVIEEEYQEALERGASSEELEEIEGRMLKGLGKQSTDDIGRRISGGRIILTSRHPDTWFVINTGDSRIDKAILDGINRCKKVYVPVYDSAEQKNSPVPDNRTTIHWRPSLKLDEEGKSFVRFFTADRPSFYTVVIEGITDNGIPCRYEYLLKR